LDSLFASPSYPLQHQSHWGREGTDRADLATGELAGGEVVTSGSLAMRRTRYASRKHWRSSRLSSAACMAVRRRGSLAVCWSQPWQRQAKCARGPRGQGGQKAEEDGGNGEAEGLRPRRPSTAAMAPVAEKTTRLGFTLARWTAVAEPLNLTPIRSTCLPLGTKYFGRALNRTVPSSTPNGRTQKSTFNIRIVNEGVKLSTF
jgi:hypothetical protein